MQKTDDRPHFTDPNDYPGEDFPPAQWDDDDDGDDE